jgi:hypothetical protein
VFVSLGVVSMCVLAVPSRAAAAVTLYVSPAGSDSNPGTAQQPFRTIQRAADLVNPGDTVIVEDGVYPGSGTATPCGSQSIVCVHRGGTASAPVTFRARNRWGAKLDGRQNQSTDGIRVIGGASYVHIEGFEIFGAGNAAGSSAGVELYSGGAYSVIAGNHIHDIGRLCTDTSNGQDGIYVRQPGVLITGNRIHDIGRYGPGEQGCAPSTAYYQTHDHGVYASGSVSPGPSDLVIANNVFYNHRRGWAVHLYPGTLNNVSILNNTFAFENPDRPGHIVLYANTSNTRIINNVFYRPKTAAIFYGTGTQTNLQVTNNVVYNGTMMTTVPSGTTMAANQVGDPLLTNTTSAPYDFHLTAQSPAINAALSLTEVTADFDGTPRATGVADIGAFEYGNDSAVATPPTSNPSPSDDTGGTAGSDTGTPGGNGGTTNLLANGGFESSAAALAPWQPDTYRQTAAYAESFQPHSGSNNAACWSPYSRDCGLYTDVRATRTGTYTLKLYATADREGGLVGANVNGGPAASAGVAARGWRNYGDAYVMTFPARQGDTIRIWMYSPATPGYVVIDDVSLTTDAP